MYSSIPYCWQVVVNNYLVYGIHIQQYTSLPRTDIIIQHTHTLLYIYSIIKIKIYLITIIELNYKLCLLYFVPEKVFMLQQFPQ